MNFSAFHPYVILLHTLKQITWVFRDNISKGELPVVGYYVYIWETDKLCINALQIISGTPKINFIF